MSSVTHTQEPASKFLRKGEKSEDEEREKREERKSVNVVKKKIFMRGTDLPCQRRTSKHVRLSCLLIRESREERREEEDSQLKSPLDDVDANVRSGKSSILYIEAHA